MKHENLSLCEKMMMMPSFQSHICVFMNENPHVLEQLITVFNYYLFWIWLK